ncbi:MAG: hypothetical protein O7G30_10505, partial [Proteobacteria bacterium]|nr:hypothetical protein [Pseudomonadota bacterium]
MLAASILAEAGFRVPAVRAVFGDVEPVPGAARPATRCELAAWLRDPEHHPVFAKPLRGRQGRGAARTCRYDAATDRIELYDGDRVSVEGFIDSLLAALHALRLERVGSGTSDGLVFQEVVRQHPAVVERCGDGLGCLRAYVIVDRGKPRILEWAWKIPAPGVAIDTFRRHSNLLAAIDAETGEVVRLIRGLGPAEEELLDNPHTGLRLVGWSLPDFAALRDCVLRGATLFPDVRFQGWDVAIGADGPVVVEVNAGSGFFPAQLATARGFWNAEFRAFVRRAERENPTRPRGLRRLVRAEDALRRVQEFGRLLR